MQILLKASMFLLGFVSNSLCSLWSPKSSIKNCLYRIPRLPKSANCCLCPWPFFVLTARVNYALDMRMCTFTSMESIAVDFFVFTFKDRSIQVESILNKLPCEKDLKDRFKFGKDRFITFTLRKDRCFLNLSI